MADAGLHPANQGALEGKPENVPPAPAAVSVNGLMSASNGEGDARQQEEQDHISRKLTEMQVCILCVYVFFFFFIVFSLSLCSAASFAHNMLIICS